MPAAVPLKATGGRARQPGLRPAPVELSSPTKELTAVSEVLRSRLVPL